MAKISGNCFPMETVTNCPKIAAQGTVLHLKLWLAQLKPAVRDQDVRLAPCHTSKESL